MGAAGPTVSPLGLGTWRGFESPSRRCADILGACVDAGVTFIDTAESYADGQAVRSLGRLLSFPRRDAFFLSTKVCYGNSELPGTGLGRRRVRAGLHWTLRALDTDNVDLLQAHDFDEETPLRDVVTTFGELVHEGKIGCWGTSRWSAEHVLDAVRLADEMRLPRPVSNQTQLSLLQQTADTDVLPACRSVGVGTIAFWALAQGDLTGKYLPGAQPPPGTRAYEERDRTAMAPNTRS